MNVIKNENIEPFDVDETLVMHQDPSTIPPGDKVQVYDYLTKKFISMRMNKPMIRLLKESKARGFYVIVWSRGGNRWATDVLKALELTEHVDLVMSKPTKVFDDKAIEDWCTDRIYLSPDTIYKQSQ